MLKLYLDWNVITTLRQIDELTNPLDKETFNKLAHILIAGREKLILPYSNAHLKDLSKSYKKGERKRVTESLNFISLLTQDICLTQYWNEEKAKWHYRNPKTFFESLIKDVETTNSLYGLKESLAELGLSNVFDSFKLLPHNIDFQQLEQNKVFSLIFKRAKLENSLYALMEDITELFGELRNNPVVYNELRSMFTTVFPLDPKIHNVPNVVERLRDKISKTMINESFKGLKENTNKTSKNEDYTKIIGTFMQLDFAGYGTDKLTEKNQYDNLFNDSLHCFYGAHCDFFITADKKTYKKTKAVYQSEGILTQVMKPSEFVELLENTNS
ncbi:MAG: hypothetical protein JWO09_864 [Bacteroidetes bacterium]|nr:hypothetical protein [Bacteroidota bacterium]